MIFEVKCDKRTYGPDGARNDRSFYIHRLQYPAKLKVLLANFAVLSKSAVCQLQMSGVTTPVPVAIMATVTTIDISELQTCQLGFIL